MWENNMKKFTDRFGTKKSLEKPQGEFDFSIGDVVFSETMGLCLIQGYAHSNQYWCENGIFCQSDWKTDVVKLATKTEREVFLNGYLKKFREYMEKFFPVGGEFRHHFIEHENWIKQLINS